MLNGDDVGRGDFVLLDEISRHSFIQNLRLRLVKVVSHFFCLCVSVFRCVCVCARPVGDLQTRASWRTRSVEHRRLRPLIKIQQSEKEKETKESVEKTSREEQKRSTEENGRAGAAENTMLAVFWWSPIS